MTLARKVAVNTATLTVGRLALAVSGLIGTAATTRYLGLEAFGALTVALLLVSVFATLGDGGVYQVVARELARRPEEESRLLANTLALGTVVAIGTVGLALAVSTVAYAGGERARIHEGVAILALQLLITGLNGTALAYLTARQRLTPMALAAILSSLTFVVALGVVIALDLGFTGVVASYAAGALVTAVPSLWVLRGHLRLGADLPLWGYIARRAVPQGIVVVLGVVYFRLDSILLSLLSTEREVALYGLGYKVVEVLIFVPAYFVATLFPEFARAERHSPRLAGMTQAGFTLLQLMAVAIVMVFVGFAGETVRAIGGPGFGAAAGVLALLTAGLLFLYLNTLFFQALIAMGEQRRLVWMVLAVLAVNVLLNFLLIPPLGAVGSAVSVLACEILSLAIGMRLYRSLAGELPRLFRVPQVLASAAVGVLGILAAKQLGQATGAPDLVVVAAGAPLALALFAAGLVVLRSVPGEIVDLTAALRRRLRERPATR